MIRRAFRGCFRILANHCIVPKLRLFFFRLSGINIGKEAFINMGLTVIDNYSKGLVTFGNRVSIAPNVTIVTHSNPNNSILRNISGLSKEAPVVIGDDAWIGTGVVILPGVRIGKCAIVGSNSLVNKDVKDYTLVVGSPARTVRSIQDELFNARVTEDV